MGLFGENEEEKRIRLKADKAQAQYEKEIGTQVPEEQGIEEDTTIEDAALTALTGPAGLAKKAGTFALGQAKKSVMADVKKKGMDSLSQKARGEALVREGALKEIGSDAGAFGSKVAAEAKQNRWDAQKLKDVREGIKKPGGDIKQSPPLNYGEIEKSRIAKLREEGGPTLDYKAMNKVDRPEAGVIDYSKLPKDPGPGSSGKKLVYSKNRRDIKYQDDK